MVGRHTLDVEIGVQVPVPELKKNTLRRKIAAICQYLATWNLLLASIFYLLILFLALHYSWLDIATFVFLSLISLITFYWQFRSWGESILGGLLMTEIIWAGSFLPFDPFSLAGILGVNYFAISEILSGKKIKATLIIYFSALALVFLTSRWI